MKVPDPESEESVAKQILSYLRRHPAAKDSVDGVMTWWVPKRIAATNGHVQRALDELVKSGLLVTHRTSGGEVYYSLGRQE